MLQIYIRKVNKKQWLGNNMQNSYYSIDLKSSVYPEEVEIAVWSRFIIIWFFKINILHLGVREMYTFAQPRFFIAHSGTSTKNLRNMYAEFV